jgi:hypothetical protein
VRFYESYGKRETQLMQLSRVHILWPISHSHFGDTFSFKNGLVTRTDYSLCKIDQQKCGIKAVMMHLVLRMTSPIRMPRLGRRLYGMLQGPERLSTTGLWQNDAIKLFQQFTVHYLTRMLHSGFMTYARWGAKQETKTRI